MAQDELYHTLRKADGSWQSAFGVVETQVAGGPPGFAGVDCSGVADALHLVGVGTDAQLYHTMRTSNGSWQAVFGAVKGQVKGGPPEFHAVACGGIGTGPNGQPYHTFRRVDGSWQSSLGAIRDQVRGGPVSFGQVGCAAASSSLHVVALGNDGRLYHTIRRADGSWQSSFGSIASQVSGGPAGFGDVACAGIGGALHVVVEFPRFGGHGIVRPLVRRG
jgi:hypothetical protein